MNYAVGDIGNTLIKVSLLNNNFKIMNSYSIETKKIFNQRNKLKFLNKILGKEKNKNILFSSVVPKAFQVIKSYLAKKNFRAIELKNLNIKKIINLKVDKFKEVGSDRIANALGSLRSYKRDCIVIDFGTATTFDIINKNGSYEGGVIAPGINSSIMNLNNSTALLPIINLKSKKIFFGKNTKDALNSGFLWGYQGLINNIIKKITLSGKKNYKIILTGGYAKLFKKFIIMKPVIDQNITIKGIINIYRELLI